MTRPHFALAILLPLLFIVLSGTGFILYLTHTMKTPLHSHDTEVLFVVKPGSGFRKVAEDLENRGLIGNADLFILWAVYHKKTGSVKAGEFSLSSSMPPEQILEKLIAGKVYQHSITVPEGFNIWEIAGLWDQSGNGSKADFLANLDRYEFPGFERPDTGWEGYLFPDTYHFPSGTSSSTLISMMITRFWSVMKPGWIEHGQMQGLTLHQIVTLASLIEKEARLGEEQPIISSVFHNRLRRGMMLQCDPTVIYGQARDGDSEITHQDIAGNHPYNTYRFAGLPPGPIANPGESALIAACYPASTPYLYFVVSDNGKHAFSATLERHLQAVARYRMKKRANPDKTSSMPVR